VADEVGALIAAKKAATARIAEIKKQKRSLALEERTLQALQKGGMPRGRRPVTKRAKPAKTAAKRPTTLAARLQLRALKAAAKATKAAAAAAKAAAGSNGPEAPAKRRGRGRGQAPAGMPETTAPVS
jgi:hypothetical protein